MAKKDMEKMKNCCPHPHGGFPTFAVILLIVGILWLLADTGVIAANIPWVPIILIIVAIVMLFHKVKKK